MNRRVAIVIAVITVGVIVGIAFLVKYLVTSVPQNTQDFEKRITSFADFNADPCNDFYQYACGGFEKSMSVDEETGSVLTFELIGKENEKFLFKLFKEVPGSKEPLLSRLNQVYQSCLNGVDKKNEEAIKPFFEKIDKAKFDNPEERAIIMSEFVKLGWASFLSIAPSLAFDDPSINSLWTFQGTIFLSSKTEYLEQKKVDGLKALLSDLAKLVPSLGLSSEDITKIVDLDGSIAKISLLKAQLFGTTFTSKRVPLSEVEKLFPYFKWTTLLKAIGVANPENETIVIPQEDYMKGLNSILSKADADVVKKHMKVFALNSMQNYLGEGIRSRYNKFNEVIYGTKANTNNEQRCAKIANTFLPVLVSHQYIKEKFSKDDKKKAVDMVRAIRESIQKMLQTTHWLDDATRAAAMKKLSQLNSDRVGYPEYYESADKVLAQYKDFQVTDNLAQTAFNFQQWAFNRQMKQLGKGSDPDNWGEFESILFINAGYVSVFACLLLLSHAN
jgi:predicted metalloendopeptidase